MVSKKYVLNYITSNYFPFIIPKFGYLTFQFPTPLLVATGRQTRGKFSDALSFQKKALNSVKTI